MSANLMPVNHPLVFLNVRSEPALALFNNKYFLTLRNDCTAYVTTSDDGAKLGGYNTRRIGFRTTVDVFLLISAGLKRIRCLITEMIFISIGLVLLFTGQPKCAATVSINIVRLSK